MEKEQREKENDQANSNNVEVNQQENIAQGDNTSNPIENGQSQDNNNNLQKDDPSSKPPEEIKESPLESDHPKDESPSQPEPSSNIPVEEEKKEDPSNNLNTVENQDLPVDHPIQKTIDADDEQKDKTTPQHDQIDDNEREEQSSDSEDD